MKISPNELMRMKGIEQIPMLTAYTYPIARAIARADIPVILVGDTVGMVEMGFDTTRKVTMEHMAYHIGAVRRGAPQIHIVGDLPYQSDINPEMALINAKRLLEAGADSIKLEGPKLEVIAYLVENGIAVVGHVGLTPQTAKNFKQIGVLAEDARKITSEARDIQTAGAFMIVLEHIPSDVAKVITESLPIPTIGIGAGPSCDGQVLVINDVLGIGDRWPPFSKQYSYVGDSVVEAAQRFSSEVKSQTFFDHRQS